MNRKVLLTLVLVFFIMGVSVAQAASPIWITVTSNGKSIEQGQVSNVPLNTKANVTVYYYDKGKAAVAILEVWYRSASNQPWKMVAIPFVGIIGKNGKAFTESFIYTLKKPGYYKFVWAVQNRPCSFKIVCAEVAPVLPEASTLAGLALSVTALGLVFAKKRF